MQTILGANGQIAEELARELCQHYTTDIRLVSRNPKKVNASDTLLPANLLDADATDKAVAGSQIAYLTVGLPMNGTMWAEQFPVMMKNVMAACKKHQCKLVFFDNTYMYAKTAELQTENSPFLPVGQKSTVRAQIATMLLAEMEHQQIEAVICRAPEFYGPAKTQSLTNTFIFDNIKYNKKLKVPLTDDTLRTLIWTPDASRAMALIGNTPDAFQQTWHLPCDDQRLTYQQLIQTASHVYQQELRYFILKSWMFKVGGVVSQPMKEIQELLPRYRYDNLFNSDKFQQRFPDFRITSYQEGMRQIMHEQRAASSLS